MRAATASASSTFASRPFEPGMTSSPAARMAALAGDFSPMSSITRGLGPMNVMPCCTHKAAKRAFSARKPQPGWIADAFVCSAACTMRSKRR
jgi:hypothetical protein